MTTQTLSHLGYVRHRTPVQKLVSSKVFWLILVTILFSYPIYRSMNRELPPPKQPLFEAPKFQLTNGFGQKFGSQNLQGRVYIANFFYTQCPMSSCSEVMDKMQEVQKRVRGLGQSIALVSFTVDPAHDTPEKLHSYARDLQANPHIWHFLTGKRETLKNTLIQGFKVPMGKRKPIDSPSKDLNMYKIEHSSQLALVNAEGDVLGFYGITDQAIDRLMIDVGLVVNREELYK